VRHRLLAAEHRDGRQLLVPGLIYMALALITDGAYALLAASIGSRFSRGLLRRSMLRYVRGSVYLGLGLCTALISRQP
jgi:threonine/homoserine/homoserine lactone efflux protein